ncbi:ribonuclease P protein component, partial [bacterium]|nr:ribonuclease P protein component [bacterium]
MTSTTTPTTGQRQTFAKNERLRSSERISVVITTGRRYRADGLSLIVVPAPGAGLRAGFIVRRKLGGAVVRNLMKRRMRESYRRIKSGVRPGADLVFSANAVADYHSLSRA